MNDITIVTAFFDIGRGDWTPDKGLPHYLQRTTQTYLERFGHMAKLENDMIVYTSKELADQVKFLRQDRPTEILTIDFDESFKELRESITKVQKDSTYQSKINPMQVRNPEYWNANYVLVNLLKASFVNRAIQMNLIKDDLAAWLDFGYCREESTLNGVKKWQYPFNRDKIHFFNIKDFQEGTFIENVIFNNDVHITGPCIVAGKEMWPKLEHLVHHNTNELLKNNLIDDDQTLLLMSYLSTPELFELHRVSEQDWFIAFKDYNENIS
jgi:protein YibB